MDRWRGRGLHSAYSAQGAEMAQAASGHIIILLDGGKVHTFLTPVLDGGERSTWRCSRWIPEGILHSNCWEDLQPVWMWPEVKHPAGIEHWLVTFFFTSELILSSVMKFCSIWRHIWERYCTRQASQPTRRRARLANQASTRMSLPSRADTCFAVGSWCGASVFFRLASCFYMLCGQWQVLERSTATVLKYTCLEPDVAVSSTNIIYVLVVSNLVNEVRLYTLPLDISLVSSPHTSLHFIR